MGNVSLMQWHPGRSTAALQSVLPQGFAGIIQCDAYQASESFVARSAVYGAITLAGCMAHARRYFFEARDEGQDAQWVLARMQLLYQIEARLRKARASPQEVLAARQKDSAPLMEGIRQQLEALHQRGRHRPTSLTGKAITYALNPWSRLKVFLTDGRVQIDNNLVENAIRPSAIGRKNWLFMGDVTTGERAAAFYTLIGNCQRAGINAEAYLTDIFERLPSETTHTVHRLTPKAWAAEQAARRNTVAQAAAMPV